MTKISIIMPVYNSENYLAATLECLQNQIFKDLPDWVYTFGIKLEYIIRRIKQANYLHNKIVPN